MKINDKSICVDHHDYVIDVFADVTVKNRYYVSCQIVSMRVNDKERGQEGLKLKQLSVFQESKTGIWEVAVVIVFY